MQSDDARVPRWKELASALIGRWEEPRWPGRATFSNGGRRSRGPWI